MTSMPPPALRIYIVEVSEPDWVDHRERVQEIYTNVRISQQDRFTIQPEHRFHPEKYCTNVRLNTSERNTRNIYAMDWWFTGFHVVNQGYHHRDLQDIPLLDFESRLLQDLLFEQSRPISLLNLRGSDDLYRSVLNHRFEILRMFPHGSEIYDYNYNTQAVRRRLSFSLRDLEPPRTPEQRRRYRDDDVDFYEPNIDIHSLRLPPRSRERETRRREQNVMVEPQTPVIVPQTPSLQFSLPSFVTQAIIQSHVQQEKACSITMTPFKEIKDITITSCYHCFDQEALSRWMIENQTCPECRKPIDGTSNYRNEF